MINIVVVIIIIVGIIIVTDAGRAAAEVGMCTGFAR